MNILAKVHAYLPIITITTAVLVRAKSSSCNVPALTHLVSGFKATTPIIRRKLKVMPYNQRFSHGSFCLVSPGNRGYIHNDIIPTTLMLVRAI